MSSAIPSLWPTDLAPTVERTPLVILKEQATQLGTQTKNLLVGRVETFTSMQEWDRIFQHVFSIVAPTLDNYRYRLLDVSHGIEPYPLTARLFVGPASNLTREQKLSSEEEFLAFLRTAFASVETRTIIGALLAQVQS